MNILKYFKKFWITKQKDEVPQTISTDIINAKRLNIEKVAKVVPKKNTVKPKFNESQEIKPVKMPKVSKPTSKKTK
jgi:hypothetical protein